jgi:hypothetical protein
MPNLFVDLLLYIFYVQGRKRQLRNTSTSLTSLRVEIWTQDLTEYKAESTT